MKSESHVKCRMAAKWWAGLGALISDKFAYLLLIAFPNMSSSRELESFVHACTPPARMVWATCAEFNEMCGVNTWMNNPKAHILSFTLPPPSTHAHTHTNRPTEWPCMLLFWFTLKNKESFHLTLPERTVCVTRLQAGAWENTWLKGSEPKYRRVILSLLPCISLQGQDTFIILSVYSLPFVLGRERLLEREWWMFQPEEEMGVPSTAAAAAPPSPLPSVPLQCSDILKISFPLHVASLSNTVFPHK